MGLFSGIADGLSAFKNAIVLSMEETTYSIHSGIGALYSSTDSIIQNAGYAGEILWSMLKQSFNITYISYDFFIRMAYIMFFILFALFVFMFIFNPILNRVMKGKGKYKDKNVFTAFLTGIFSKGFKYILGLAIVIGLTLLLSTFGKKIIDNGKYGSDPENLMKISSHNNLLFNHFTTDVEDINLSGDNVLYGYYAGKKGSEINKTNINFYFEGDSNKKNENIIHRSYKTDIISESNIKKVTDDFTLSNKSKNKKVKVVGIDLNPKLVPDNSNKDIIDIILKAPDKKKLNDIFGTTNIDNTSSYYTILKFTSDANFIFTDKATINDAKLTDKTNSLYIIYKYTKNETKGYKKDGQYVCVGSPYVPTIENFFGKYCTNITNNQRLLYDITPDGHLVVNDYGYLLSILFSVNKVSSLNSSYGSGSSFQNKFSDIIDNKKVQNSYDLLLEMLPYLNSYHYQFKVIQSNNDSDKNTMANALRIDNNEGYKSNVIYKYTPSFLLSLQYIEHKLGKNVLNTYKGNNKDFFNKYLLFAEGYNNYEIPLVDSNLSNQSFLKLNQVDLDNVFGVVGDKSNPKPKYVGIYRKDPLNEILPISFNDEISNTGANDIYKNGDKSSLGIYELRQLIYNNVFTTYKNITDKAVSYNNYKSSAMHIYNDLLYDTTPYKRSNLLGLAVMGLTLLLGFLGFFQIATGGLKALFVRIIEKLNKDKVKKIKTDENVNNIVDKILLIGVISVFTLSISSFYWIYTIAIQFFVISTMLGLFLLKRGGSEFANKADQWSEKIGHSAKRINERIVNKDENNNEKSNIIDNVARQGKNIAGATLSFGAKGLGKIGKRIRGAGTLGDILLKAGTVAYIFIFISILSFWLFTSLFHELIGTTVSFNTLGGVIGMFFAISFIVVWFIMVVNFYGPLSDLLVKLLKDTFNNETSLFNKAYNSYINETMMGKVNTGDIQTSKLIAKGAEIAGTMLDEETKDKMSKKMQNFNKNIDLKINKDKDILEERVNKIDEVMSNSKTINNIKSAVNKSKELGTTMNKTIKNSANNLLTKGGVLLLNSSLNNNKIKGIDNEKGKEMLLKNLRRTNTYKELQNLAETDDNVKNVLKGLDNKIDEYADLRVETLEKYKELDAKKILKGNGLLTMSNLADKLIKGSEFLGVDVENDLKFNTLHNIAKLLLEANLGGYYNNINDIIASENYTDNEKDVVLSVFNDLLNNEITTSEGIERIKENIKDPDKAKHLSNLLFNLNKDYDNNILKQFSKLSNKSQVKQVMYNKTYGNIIKKYNGSKNSFKRELNNIINNKVRDDKLKINEGDMIKEQIDNITDIDSFRLVVDSLKNKGILEDTDISEDVTGLIKQYNTFQSLSKKIYKGVSLDELEEELNIFKEDGTIEEDDVEKLKEYYGNIDFKTLSKVDDSVMFKYIDTVKSPFVDYKDVISKSIKEEGLRNDILYEIEKVESSIISKGVTMGDDEFTKYLDKEKVELNKLIYNSVGDEENKKYLLTSLNDTIDTIGKNITSLKDDRGYDEETIYNMQSGFYTSMLLGGNIDKTIVTDVYDVVTKNKNMKTGNLKEVIDTRIKKGKEEEILKFNIDDYSNILSEETNIDKDRIKLMLSKKGFNNTINNKKKQILNNNMKLLNETKAGKVFNHAILNKIEEGIDIKNISENMIKMLQENKDSLGKDEYNNLELKLKKINNIEKVDNNNLYDYQLKMNEIVNAMKNKNILNENNEKELGLGHLEVTNYLYNDILSKLPDLKTNEYIEKITGLKDMLVNNTGNMSEEDINKIGKYIKYIEKNMEDDSKKENNFLLSSKISLETNKILKEIQRRNKNSNMGELFTTEKINKILENSNTSEEIENRFNTMIETFVKTNKETLSDNNLTNEERKNKEKEIKDTINKMRLYKTNVLDIYKKSSETKQKNKDQLDMLSDILMAKTETIGKEIKEENLKDVYKRITGLDNIDNTGLKEKIWYITTTIGKKDKTVKENINNKIDEINKIKTKEDKKKLIKGLENYLKEVKNEYTSNVGKIAEEYKEIEKKEKYDLKEVEFTLSSILKKEKNSGKKDIGELENTLKILQEQVKKKNKSDDIMILKQLDGDKTEIGFISKKDKNKIDGKKIKIIDNPKELLLSNFNKIYGEEAVLIANIDKTFKDASIYIDDKNNMEFVKAINENINEVLGDKIDKKDKKDFIKKLLDVKTKDDLDNEINGLIDNNNVGIEDSINLKDTFDLMSELFLSHGEDKKKIEQEQTKQENNEMEESNEEKIKQEQDLQIQNQINKTEQQTKTKQDEAIDKIKEKAGEF